MVQLHAGAGPAGPFKIQGYFWDLCMKEPPQHGMPHACIRMFRRPTLHDSKRCNVNSLHALLVRMLCAHDACLMVGFAPVSGLPAIALQGNIGANSPQACQSYSRLVSQLRSYGSCMPASVQAGGVKHAAGRGALCGGGALALCGLAQRHARRATGTCSLRRMR